MLYVTTRNNRDAFTAQRALRENRAPDSGFYLPMRTPRFSPEAIASLESKSFGQNVADVLNLLFNTTLTSWDIDFCIGRYPVRFTALQHRILMAETWHNPQWTYDRVVNNLVSHLCDEMTSPGNWATIAVRIAVLFGIYGELKRLGIETADISLVSGDFSGPISAWYARQWGLPVGNIICCCNENNSLWDLICHGQLRTDALSIPTAIPEADIVIPENLERLIYEAGGTLEVQRYLESCHLGRTYCPNDGVLSKLRSGMYVSVVSSSRLESTIPGVYRTNQYLMSPASALAYAGLLDYRAKTGETRHAIVLSDQSPRCHTESIADFMNMNHEQLQQLIRNS